MADRLYCALNGTTLRDLDARIHLLDVEELAPAVRTVTAAGCTCCAASGSSCPCVSAS